MLQKHCLSRTLLLPTLLSLSLCMGGCGWKQSTEKSVPDPKLSTQEKKNTPVSDGLLAHLTFDEALSATSGQDATEHFRYTITNGKTNKIKESVGPGLFKNALQCDGRTFASIPDLAPYAINRENQGAISVWFYADAEQVSLRNVILSLTNQWGLNLSAQDYTVWNALNIFYTSPRSEVEMPSLQVVNSCRQQTLDDKDWWTTSWGADGARCTIHLKKYPCSPNQWHLVVVNGGDFGWQVYLDGQMIQHGPEKIWLKKDNLPRSSEATIRNGSINSVLIGASHTGTPWDDDLRYDNFFKGKIDDFRYYGRNLQQDQVDKLYLTGKNMDKASVASSPVTHSGMPKMAQENALLKRENDYLKKRVQWLEQNLK